MIKQYDALMELDDADKDAAIRLQDSEMIRNTIHLVPPNKIDEKTPNIKFR